MSISTLISRIQQAKDDIKTYVNSIGGEIGENDTLDDYLTQIQAVTNFTNIGFGGAMWTTLPKWAEVYVLSLTSIPNHMFSYSTLLTTVNLGPNTTKIGGGAFEGCRGITSLTLPSSLTTIDTQAFQKTGAMTNFIIPNSVTSIGTHFLYNSNVLKVTYSGGMEYIPANGFNGCTQLLVLDLSNCNTVLRFGSDSSNPAVGNTTYINTASLQYIVVKDSLVSNYKNSSYWTTFKNYIISKTRYEAL